MKPNPEKAAQQIHEAHVPMSSGSHLIHHVPQRHIYNGSRTSFCLAFVLRRCLTAQTAVVGPSLPGTNQTARRQVCIARYAILT